VIVHALPVTTQGDPALAGPATPAEPPATVDAQVDVPARPPPARRAADPTPRARNAKNGPETGMSPVVDESEPVEVASASAPVEVEPDPGRAEPAASDEPAVSDEPAATDEPSAIDAADAADEQAGSAAAEPGEQAGSGAAGSDESPQAGAEPEPAATSLRPLVEALTALRRTLTGTTYALTLPSAAPARRIADGIVRQLDDYLLPRLGRLDAPLLVVVGGSTGAGKSTLVNSLVRAPVSPAGVLRPTTRAPVLVCNPTDGPWFTEAHLLPGLTRTAGRPTDQHTLQVVTAPALTAGLAFLDAPDIDSVVDANRALAVQLLAAADLWLFVTTAARYADAVPWDLLHAARGRGTAIALLLDRVPPGAEDAVAPHFAEMLSEHDLGSARLFVLPETRLDSQGLLSEATIGELRDWFADLARSAAARAAVVRQTVEGAIVALGPALAALSDAAADQVTATEALATGVHTAYRTAQSTVERGIHDGVLLRGEVLARWQELVGTGDMMRALQARVGRLRDRVTAAITGRTAPGGQFQAALESGLVALVRSAAADAAEQAANAWRLHPAGAVLLRSTREDAVDLAAPAPDLPGRVERLVRDWQRGVLDLVRDEAGNKRTLARASAYAVNATGLLVMISVFAATSFIPTGAEIAVAGGTTIAAQKVLEAIFGDQAVRELAEHARDDLLVRVKALLDREAARFERVLAEAGVDPEAAARLDRASAEIDAARRAAPLPEGGQR
jgi:hypothetical protein